MKNNSDKRAPSESVQQNSPPEKVGWIRKFCGKGIFREIWKNRFVVLRGDQLFICAKEVKELSRADEVLDLSDYERCEEIRKLKSRSKKNHSKFRLQRCSTPGNTVPNLVFLAVSPEEKESWINILNASITKAKNRILDEVMVEDSQLSHLTRDRVRIPQNRRLPTRGHLLAVASTSSSDGMLMLDLIQEEDSASLLRIDTSKDFGEDLEKPECPRSKTDGALLSRTAECYVKSKSLPRETVVCERVGSVHNPQLDDRLTSVEKSRCSSMDEILTHSESRMLKNNSQVTSQSVASTPTETMPLSRLQELISQKLEQTERLLTQVRPDEDQRVKGGKLSTEAARAEAERLLKEATVSWNQAHKVLQEVQELKVLYQQLDPSHSVSPSNSTKKHPNRNSLM
ncbi:pleckstrin homology domain-containing family O member 1b [Nothobranchius furzeri]|uniref:Pleckstrin homology domain containing, family O member 1b n=3 Tax=Nothobranchius TaxID=28779 RepID=A0A1A8AWJ9_NOTFU|nr:pleckstrin homology domain-containing family O member 1b [Nothobranchius furzeri]KAF7226417.1 pleckstrin homology domain-containing family O member 1-like [Nothobranchius furzeri]